MRHLALLRGINVGGKRALPMRDLESAFRAAGATEIATVIQSGNVVFASDHPEMTCATAATAIQANFGFSPPIVLRSAKAWRAMAEANPFLGAGAAPEMLHVACFAGEPGQPLATPVDQQAFLPDELVRIGRDVYLKLPDGVGRANLTNARLDRMFGAVSTMRNWRTVLRLLDRLGA